MKTPKHQDYNFNLDHESRIIRLESIIENIQQTLIRLETKIDKLDSRVWFVFCFLLTTMLGMFTALLGVMAHGFHWI